MSWPLSQDYNEAIQDPRNSFSDAELKKGEASANALGIPMPRSGNFADVYEVRCPSGSRWAVKCFTREVFGLRERYAEIGKYLRLAKLPFMVDFQYLEQGIRVRGQWYPILKMQWVEGFLLNEFVRDNLDKKPILQGLGQIWVKMARRLRESYIAHCDLQHGNVLFVPGSTASSLAVKLIDYDGMCVPSLVGTKSGEVGHPAYQHPERLRTGAYDQEVDRFSLLSIAAALRCLSVGGRSLWERYDTGDNLLFRQADFQAPKESPLFQELLAIHDPQAQILVKELQSACQKPLDAAPLLTDLLPELQAPAASKPAAGPKRTTVAKASAAQASTEAAAPSSAWDFEGEEMPRSRRQRTSGLPHWTRYAVAVGLAGLVLAGGIVALALRKGSEKPNDEARAAQNNHKTSTQRSGHSQKLPEAKEEQSDEDTQHKDDVAPQPPATANVPQPQEVSDPPNDKRTDGFVPLFNGKNLAGWIINPADPSQWRVDDDGAIVSAGSGRLYTQRKDYANFHLKAEVKVDEGCCGSIRFRSRMQKGPEPGYAVLLNGASNDPRKTGSLTYTKQMREQTIQLVDNALVGADKWFSLEIFAAGGRFVVKVEGKSVVDFETSEQGFATGYIALQHRINTRGSIHCRKIEIKELSSAEAATLPKPGEVLTPVQAASKAGQKVTVQLRVQGGGTNGEFAELYSEPAWDREGNMFLRFPEPSRKKFQDIGIPDVGRHFIHKLIRVSGTVAMLRIGDGTYPCIVIDDPEQIKEVSRTAVAGNPVPAPNRTAGWDHLVDPDGDCQFRDDKGKLTITVPAKVHGMTLKRNDKKSPRLLREVEGDFTIQVRVGGDFTPAAASSTGEKMSWIGAGLFLWVDENTFIRLERAGWYDRKPTTLYANWEVHQDGKYIDTKYNFPNLRAAETYLRLERRGKQLLASYSEDGQSWVAANPQEIELPAKVQIGVLAGSNTGRPFAPTFDQLQIKRGQGEMVRIDNWLAPAGTVTPGKLAWEPIDPDRDCKFRENEGKLTITVPAKPHVLDLSVNGMNSPRVLREVEGDFTAQVRVRGDFIPAAVSTSGRFSWLGAGLLLWVNDNTFLRLEVAAWHERKPSTLYANWEVRQDGKSIDVKHNYASLYSGEQYLRLERRGKQILASYSPNGQSWNNVKPLDIELPAKVKIGVLAGSTTSRTFAPAFDQFQLKQGQGDMVRIDNWLKPATAGAVIVKPPQPPRRRRLSNRMAVPDTTTLADKQKEVRVMYRDDYKGMSKRKLASRLYDDSMRQGDMALRYVMLNESCDLAAQDGDLTVALRAASKLASRFDVDPLEVKSRVLEKTLPVVPARDKVTYRLLTQMALLFLDRAEIDEGYDRGERLLEIAKTAAAKADMSAVLTKVVVKEEKQLKALRDEYDAVKRFANKLETDPDDADASLALGRFRCFIRGDWDAGLPLLVKGSDKALSELAQKDVADPADAAARAALGDAWANWADKRIGNEQEACRRRAYSWYQDSLDDLDKKERARVNARLAKLTTQVPELKRSFSDFDTGIATINRKSRLLHLPLQHAIATRQLYHGPIDIRVKALLTRGHIRITFLNGGELVIHPENRTTRARVYSPYSNDPDSQGFGPNTYFVSLQPGLNQIRILVTADGWTFWVNDKLVGNQNGPRGFSFASSPVRVWSDDGEVEIQSLVVKRVR